MNTRDAITLVAVDCAYAPLAAAALARSASALPVARVLLLTDAAITHDGVEVLAIAPIKSRAAYSQFVIKELGNYITTDYALVVQWDGFVIDGSAWAEEFWNYDYIGAKWPHLSGDFRVGNGGFSLRSKRLLTALNDPAITLNADENEDEAICVRYRDLLETKYGIVFADERVADRFAFDVGRPVGPTLGFHGVFNFWQVLNDDELFDFARTAPQAIAQGMGFGALTRNLVDLKRAELAQAFVTRRLAEAPEEQSTLALLARLNAAKTISPTPEPSIKPPSSRNDPCPCTSGKRYKDCHGKLGAAPATQALLAVDEVLADALQHHERGDEARRSGA